MIIHRTLDKRALLVIAKEQNNRSSRHIENNFRQNGHGWLDENQRVENRVPRTHVEQDAVFSVYQF